MTYLHQIDPIAFTLGPLKVHWYGIMYMLGFAAAWALGRRRVRAGRLPGVDEQAYSDLLFYSMLGVIFGARPLLLGLKNELRVEDVFSVHAFDRKDGTFDLSQQALDGRNAFLADESFGKELRDTFRYMKGAKLSRLRRTDLRTRHMIRIK